jgi:hypothetical protein
MPGMLLPPVVPPPVSPSHDMSERQIAITAASERKTSAMCLMLLFIFGSPFLFRVLQDLFPELLRRQVGCGKGKRQAQNKIFTRHFLPKNFFCPEYITQYSRSQTKKHPLLRHVFTQK